MNALTLTITNLDQLHHTGTARHQFDHTGGTLGSEGASWLIKDREQTVAPIHCEIRWIEGCFCVIDRCQRTYLNDNLDSLGPLSPRRLQEGDRLRIGDFRMQVQYSHDQAQGRSLQDLFTPDHRVLDRLIADAPADTWRAHSPAPEAVADIGSVFEADVGNDPLHALDAVTEKGPSPVDPLQHLIAGERP